MTCVKCSRAISHNEPYEPYTFPSDGRWVCSSCVGHAIKECLDALARLPDQVRLIDLDEEEVT